MIAGGNPTLKNANGESKDLRTEKLLSTNDNA